MLPMGGLGTVQTIGTVRAIGLFQAECHGMTCKGFSHGELVARKANVSSLVYHAGPIGLWIADLRKRRREGASARLVVIGGHVHFPSVGREGFVGTLQVVGPPPLVEAGLALGKGLVAALLQHLLLKAAVEAFAFALCLGMVRLSKDHVDVETEEPCVEFRVKGASGPLGSRHAPGQAVVTENTTRQSIALEDGCKPLFDCLALLVRASLNPDRKAGVVINDRKRMAALSIDEREMALEVHLPKPVGLFFLEAPVGGVSRLVSRIEKAISFHDRLAGRGGRNLLGAKGELVVLGVSAEPGADLVPTSGGVLFAHLADSSLDLIGGFIRRSVWASRPLGEPVLAVFAVPIQPLVSSFSANVEPATKGGRLSP